VIPFTYEEMESPHPMVYLVDEQVWARVLSYGAYASLVMFEIDDETYVIVVENDDIMEDGN